jgi:hypothetical protein
MLGKRVLLVVGALVLGSVLLWLLERRHVPPAALEIGHATTRITQPRTPDGGVDFEAALNDGEAPPPEENAVVPLIRAAGTKILLGQRERVLQILGAGGGERTDTGVFVPRGPSYPYSDLASLDEKDRAVVRRWVAQNRRTLDLVVAASRRPRLWMPIVRDEDVRWVGGALGEPILDEALGREILRKLQSLPARPDVAPDVDRSERLVLLGGYIREVQKGVRAAGGNPAWAPANVALNAALREFNGLLDEVVPLPALPPDPEDGKPLT